jgi:hypothetical protein
MTLPKFTPGGVGGIRIGPFLGDCAGQPMEYLGMPRTLGKRHHGCTMRSDQYASSMPARSAAMPNDDGEGMDTLVGPARRQDDQQEVQCPVSVGRQRHVTARSAYLLTALMSAAAACAVLSMITDWKVGHFLAATAILAMAALMVWAEQRTDHRVEVLLHGIEAARAEVAALQSTVQLVRQAAAEDAYMSGWVDGSGRRPPVIGADAPTAAQLSSWPTLPDHRPRDGG